MLKRASIEELISKIYVDDNRAIIKKLKPGLRFDETSREFVFREEWIEEDRESEAGRRTINEISKAMNSINEDLKFTMENEEDFVTKRLPTLAFEIWSEKEGVRHSYFEKEMRSQLLTMKRSSQSENSKLAILTNELNRRFLMMDSKIDNKENIEKVNHFCQQLINSGYKWEQIREITVSSLRSVVRRENKFVVRFLAHNHYKQIMLCLAAAVFGHLILQFLTCTYDFVRHCFYLILNCFRDLIVSKLKCIPISE